MLPQLAVCPWRRQLLEYIYVESGQSGSTLKATRGKALSWSLALVQFSTLDSKADVL